MIRRLELISPGEAKSGLNGVLQSYGPSLGPGIHMGPRPVVAHGQQFRAYFIIVLPDARQLFRLIRPVPHEDNFDTRLCLHR